VKFDGKDAVRLSPEHPDDRPRLSDAFEARGNIHAVAHQIAIALFDDIANMNADTKLDTPILRNPCVPLDHRLLDFNGAVHRVHDAAELGNRAVAGALDDPAVMHGDGGIDQVAAQCPEPSENSIFIRAGKPRIGASQARIDRPVDERRASRPLPTPSIWRNGGGEACSRVDSPPESIAFSLQSCARR
jgi:hypothetical protein